MCYKTVILAFVLTALIPHSARSNDNEGAIDLTFKYCRQNLSSGRPFYPNKCTEVKAVDGARIIFRDQRIGRTRLTTDTEGRIQKIDMPVGPWGLSIYTPPPTGAVPKLLSSKGLTRITVDSTGRFVETFYVILPARTSKIPTPSQITIGFDFLQKANYESDTATTRRGSRRDSKKQKKLNDRSLTTDNWVQGIREISGKVTNSLKRPVSNARVECFVLRRTSGVSLFRIVDLKDPTSLAVKLRDARDPLSKYLRGQLSPDLQQQLEKYTSPGPPSAPLTSGLVAELNQLLKAPGLFEERRFAQVELTESTRSLLAQPPQSEDLLHLNRLLLEEAYPDELVTSDSSDDILQLDETNTNDEGEYTLQIPADRKYESYIVAATHDSFYPESVTILWDQSQPPAIVMEQESVAAESQAAATSNTEMVRRTVFQPLLMQSLPVPGLRSFDSFALLSPGVFLPPQTSNTAGPGVSPGVGTPGQFSVNGMRSRENNFTVDGSDNNDEDLGVRRQGFVALVPQSIESLQEFQIMTALADARFGRNAGGQVNALSKTGGVNLHGTLYGFLNDRRLNARDFFDQSSGPSTFTLNRSSDNSPVLLNGQPLTVNRLASGENPFTRIQMGAAIGGPIKPGGNTFFFSSLEKQIIHANKESHFAVPTVSQRGIFGTGENGVTQDHPMLGLVPLYPASVPGDAIFSLYPFPNNPAGPYGDNTYTALLPASGHGTRFSTKIDHQFQGNKKVPQGPWWKSLLNYKSYGDRITGRYNLTDERSFLPVTGGALFSTMRPKVRTQNVAFFLNRTLSPSTADTIRFSFGRTRLIFGEVRDSANLASAVLPNTSFLLNVPLLLNLTLPGGSTRYVSASSAVGTATLNSLGYSGVTQTEQITGPLGQVVIPGFSPVGVDAESFPQERANNTFQVADTITSVKGRNIVTFGVDGRKTQINSVLDRNFRPQAVFNGLFSSAPFVSLRGTGGVPLETTAFTGTTLAAAGIPTGMFQTIAAIPNSSIGIRFTQFNAFLQEERRVASNFHLIAGMRYEFNSVPDTVGDRLERALDPATLRKQAEEAVNFCNNPNNPGRCDDLVNSLAAAFPADFKVSFGADHSDIDARLGFAWAPDWAPIKDGRLAIRGGFGAYSGQFPGIVLDQSRNAFSNFLPLNYANLSPRSDTDNQTFLFNLAGPGVQQLLLRINPNLQIVRPGTLNTFSSINPIALLVNSLFDLSKLSLSSAPLGLDLVLPQRRLKTPYSLQYGLTLEYQLQNNYLISFAYVGTRGIKLLRVNTPDLGLNRSGLNSVTLEPLTASAPFPYFQGRETAPQSKIISGSFAIARTLFESSSNSTYHSLQLEVRKRYKKPLQLTSALTYSHSIDDASDFFDTAGSFALPQDSLRRSERASSNFDVRLRSVTNFIIDLPDKLPILGGSQIAGIVTAQTGQPYTVNSAFDVNHDGSLTDRLNTTNGLLVNPSGNNRIQLALVANPLTLLAPDGFDGVVGRNTFRAPGVFTCDISFTKAFAIFGLSHLRENRRVLFRTEIFNLFNRPNFGIPVRILEAPGFGRSVNTITSARTIQLALKLQF